MIDPRILADVRDAMGTTSNEEVVARTNAVEAIKAYLREAPDGGQFHIQGHTAFSERTLRQLIQRAARQAGVRVRTRFLRNGGIAVLVRHVHESSDNQPTPRA